MAIDRHRDLARLALRQAEIHQVRRCVDVDHDVAWLEIPMDDSLLVRMLKRLGNLRTDLGCFARRWTLAAEPVA